MFRLATSGFHNRRRPQALLDGHERRAPRGDVHHNVRPLFNDPQKRLERLGALIGTAVEGIARMQVDNRRPRLGGPDRRLGDLLGGDREMGRH